MKNKQLLLMALTVLSGVLFVTFARADGSNESKKGFFTIAKDLCGKMIYNDPIPTVLGTGVLAFELVNAVNGKAAEYTFCIENRLGKTNLLKNRTFGAMLLAYAGYQNIKDKL